MRKVVIKILNEKKVELLKAVAWMPKVHRAGFFNMLAEWAYGQYEATLVDDK